MGTELDQMRVRVVALEKHLRFVAEWLEMLLEDPNVPAVWRNDRWLLEETLRVLG